MKNQKVYIILVLLILLVTLIKILLVSGSSFPYGVYSYSIFMINEDLLENSFSSEDTFIDGESPWLGIPNARSHYFGMYIFSLLSVILGISLTEIFQLSFGSGLFLLFSFIITKKLTKNNLHAILVALTLILLPVHQFFNLFFSLTNMVIIADFLVIFGLIDYFVDNHQKGIALVCLGLIIAALSYYSHFILNILLVFFLCLSFVTLNPKIKKKYKIITYFILVIMIFLSLIYFWYNQYFIIEVFLSKIFGTSLFIESTFSYKNEDLLYQFIYLLFLFSLVIFATIFNCYNFLKYYKDKLFFRDKRLLFIFSWFFAFIGISIISYFFANDPLRSFEVCLVPLLLSSFLLFELTEKNNALNFKLIYIAFILVLALVLISDPVLDLQTYDESDLTLYNYITENNFDLGSVYTDLRFGSLFLAYSEDINIQGANRDTDPEIEYLFYSFNSSEIYNLLKTNEIRYMIFTDEMLNIGVYPLNFPLISVTNLDFYLDNESFNLLYNSESYIFEYINS